MKGRMDQEGTEKYLVEALEEVKGELGRVEGVRDQQLGRVKDLGKALDEAKTELINANKAIKLLKQEKVQ